MNLVKEDFKHSFSSVSQFARSPCQWICTYGLGLRSPNNPAMTRGNLSEFGAYYKIKRGMSGKDGQAFEKLIRHRFKKLNFLDAEKEIDNAIAIAKQFEKVLYERQLRNIVSYQKQIVKNIDGLKYPVRAFTDFEFLNIIVDAKSTMRMPSYPKPDHLRQQALYSVLHDKPISLLYATPPKKKDSKAKSIMYYELNDGDIENGYNEIFNHFKSLENYIIKCDNNLEEAIKTTPLNTDPNPFSWDLNIKTEAEKVWQKVMK